MVDYSTLRICSLCGKHYRDSTGHDYEKCVECLEASMLQAAARVGELTRSLKQARQYLAWQVDGTIPPFVAPTGD